MTEKPVTFFELVEKKQESTFLNRPRLARFIERFGQYPEKYR
jgi:hypothetical protein